MIRLARGPRPARPARRGAAAACCALLAALALDASPARALPEDPPLRTADYWEFVDGVVPALEPLWSSRRGAYVSSWQGASGRTNANMLIIHARAALYDHRGASRHDARARRLVAAMTRRPMARLAEQTSTRTVCWARGTDTAELDHISLDSQIAEALDHAWTARRQLGLSRKSSARIVRVLDRCARHALWRYPSCLLNQINWNAMLYAHAAHVTGHGDQMRGDYRRHLVRFSAGITRPMPGMATSNLGPSYAFHYQPNASTDERLNLDVPEYANIVASSFGYYGAARRMGMAPLPDGAKTLVRAWMMRLLAGSWTHAGYLNWDTGYGRARWHSGQYWAFSQQGLLAMATTPQFWIDPRQGRWAKAIFDRGLILYARWAREAGLPRAPQLPFGVRSEHRDHDLYAARMAANAVRAIALGLGDRPAADPPPMYSYDVDSGRVAVSTPRYSTAIVPTSRGAFAYGGIDLARLYGPGQRPAGTIGGVPPAAFGAVIRGRRGHIMLASQRLDGGRARVRLTASPRDPTLARRYPARPLAGPFRELEARGRRSKAGVHVRTIHRFRSASIDTAWRMRCDGGCAGKSMEVHFPSWGRGSVLRVGRPDGSIDLLRHGHPILARDVDHLELGGGARGGYVLRFRPAAPAAAVLAVVRPRRRSWNPEPGPTLVVRLPDRRSTLRVRIVPVGGKPDNG